MKLQNPAYVAFLTSDGKRSGPVLITMEPGTEY